MGMLTQAKRVVIKVGTSTLTHDTGRLNLRRVSKLARVLADLKNAGREVILVTSGAVGVGVGRLNLPGRPDDVAGRQAAAAVGQCELMDVYDKAFAEFGCLTGQMLLTRDAMDAGVRERNILNTLDRLLVLGVLPIINENDTVSTDELEGTMFGDNDTLSALVARLCGAGALVLLTDTDGLYDGDPRRDPRAKHIPVVHAIDGRILALAGSAGSARGTGGMATKVAAAKIAVEAGISTVIMSGEEPEKLYELFEGKACGTLFEAK